MSQYNQCGCESTLYSLGKLVKHRDNFTFSFFLLQRKVGFSNDRKCQESGILQNSLVWKNRFKIGYALHEKCLLSLVRDIALNRVINGKNARFQIKFRGEDKPNYPWETFSNTASGRYKLTLQLLVLPLVQRTQGCNRPPVTIHTEYRLFWQVSWDFPVPVGKCQDTISISPWPLPFRSFPTHQSSYCSVQSRF
jgi:hypothetical protein